MVRVAELLAAAPFAPQESAQQAMLCAGETAFAFGQTTGPVDQIQKLVNIRWFSSNALGLCQHVERLVSPTAFDEVHYKTASANTSLRELLVE